MSKALVFHFEGALADQHKMNFYESARFQYAAARLMVKLVQFRKYGRFTKKITDNSNFDVLLSSYSDGSFNINVEEPEQDTKGDDFIKLSIAELVAYVSERIIEKIDESTLANANSAESTVTAGEELSEVISTSALDKFAQSAIADDTYLSTLPDTIQRLVRRRIAEQYREQRLAKNEPEISKIDVARSQKLIAMSAPLLSEMATALRRSAKSLQIKSEFGGTTQTVLFLDQEMAEEIETAIVDDEITPILGDITQFNKDNGSGKLKIENGAKTVSFSIPSDLLPTMRQRLIDSMKTDLVYLQTYFVRDRSKAVIRLIAVGLLPTPKA